MSITNNPENSYLYNFIILEKNILVTGNTAIDALRYTVKKEFSHPLLEKVKNSKHNQRGK